VQIEPWPELTLSSAVVDRFTRAFCSLSRSLCTESQRRATDAEPLSGNLSGMKTSGACRSPALHGLRTGLDRLMPCVVGGDVNKGRTLIDLVSRGCGVFLASCFPSCRQRPCFARACSAVCRSLEQGQLRLKWTVAGLLLWDGALAMRGLTQIRAVLDGWMCGMLCEPLHHLCGEDSICSVCSGIVLQALKFTDGDIKAAVETHLSADPMCVMGCKVVCRVNELISAAAWQKISEYAGTLRQSARAIGGTRSVVEAEFGLLRCIWGQVKGDYVGNLIGEIQVLAKRVFTRYVVCDRV
jgi:hypothetical protein